MEAMTEKVVRDSWDRSVLAGWWCFMLDRALFENVALYVAVPNSDEWKLCWQMYELYAEQLSASTASESRVSGRTRKKAESEEEHDRRLEGYAEMERKRRERYEAPLTYDSDEDGDEDEKDEKQQLMAEELVEQLEECEDSEGEDDKENRPPDAACSFPWDSEWAAADGT